MAAEDYNIAVDCVDRYVRFMQTRDQPALTALSLDAAGEFIETRLSFGQVAALSNRMANAFKTLALPAEARVIIRLPNCAEFPIVFVGAVKAGLIPVPTSSLLQWPELKFVLEDSGAQALVTTSELRPAGLTRESPASLKTIVIGAKGQLLAGEFRFADLIKGSSSQFEGTTTEGEDPAYWLYTSGTEGVPKAVIHAHRSIPAHDQRVQLWQGLAQDDVIFNTSALNWSYALTCSLLDAWRHRIQTVIYNGKPDPAQLCRIIRQYQVTIFMSVPGIYRRLVRYLKETGTELPGLRVALSAGEALSAELRADFAQLTGLKIREGLGMTEHSVYLVQRQDEEPVLGSCGRPLPGQRVSILNEDLTETAVGEVGILASHRSCPGLMLAYYQRPELEAQVWQGDWFLSGDLARKDEAGNFFFVGRRDDVMTVGGYRISPLEVERVLEEHPAVSEAAVVSAAVVPDKAIIGAYVVPNSDVTEGLADAIVAFARERLAKYKVPREIMFRTSLPRTRNGKLKRAELRK